MKIMGWWARFKFGLGFDTQPEDIIRRVKRIDHWELVSLHRMFKRDIYKRGTPAEIQQRYIQRELIRRGDPHGTHKPLKMRDFVKGCRYA